MVPKTRLDRLVTVRERTEEGALENLASAQSSLMRATQRLAGSREKARRDARGAGTAELWVVEEIAHVRTLQEVRAAEGALAEALGHERKARAGYVVAHRDAEAVRRVQEKKRTEILTDLGRREQKSLDELATLAFNARRR